MHGHCFFITAQWSCAQDLWDAEGKDCIVRPRASSYSRGNRLPALERSCAHTHAPVFMSVIRKHCVARPTAIFGVALATEPISSPLLSIPEPTSTLSWVFSGTIAFYVPEAAALPDLILQKLRSLQWESGAIKDSLCLTWSRLENIALHASPTARSFALLISAFPVQSVNSKLIF